MKILVIGCGFIGQSLVEKLLLQGGEVHVFSKSEKTLIGDAKSYQGDLCDGVFVADVIQSIQPEMIYHLAAEKARGQTIDSIRPALDVNLLGTLNIFEASLKLKNMPKIVVMGTSEEYGDNPDIPFQENWRERPITAYSFSKTCQTHLCELMWRTFGLPVVVIRPSLVYGPRQGLDMFMPALIQTLLQGKPFAMTAGEQKRDFVYIDDLVECMISLQNASGIAGEIINIGSGQPIFLKDLAEMVAKKIGKTSLLNIGAVPYRKNEIFDYFVSINKVKLLLEWMPKTGLDEGLKRTIDYFRENLNETDGVLY